MNIDAVVVTYHAGTGLIENLINISPKVGKIFIFDNGAHSEFVIRRAREALGEQVVVEVSAVNMGLGYGQNWGIARSLETGSDMVLLLDQDSIFGAVDFARYRDEIESHVESGSSLSIYCPNIVDANTEVTPSFFVSRQLLPKFEPLSKNNCDRVYVCMASGMIIPSPVLRKIGLMSSHFFIDGIDTEFCLRARKAGVGIHGIADVFLRHSLGKRELRELFGARFFVTNHSPLRLYYIFRNKFLLLRTRGIVTPEFLIYDVLNSFLILFKVIFLERERTTKIAGVLYGIFSGLLRITSK